MNEKKTAFRRLTPYLKELMRQQQTQFDLPKYHKYHSILMSCIPPQWEAKIMVGKLEKGVWQLFVAHNHEAFQLRYLLPEIERQLAKRLPYPPKLKVNANPHLWQAFPQRRKPLRVKSGRERTPAEADLIISRFLAKQNSRS